MIAMLEDGMTRLTTKRKAELVLVIIESKTTVAEAS